MVPASLFSFLLGGLDIVFHMEKLYSIDTQKNKQYYVVEVKVCT